MVNIKTKSIKPLWILLFLLFLAILLVITYKLQVQPRSPLVVEPKKPCDLRESECTKALKNGGTVTFSIEPKDIPMLKNLKVDIKLNGVKASKVEIDFIQKDDALSIGYNRPELDKITDTEFQGEAFLALCANDMMTWEAKVLLHTDQGVQVATYNFLTFKFQ